MNTAQRFLIVLLAIALNGCLFPSRLAEEDPFREDVIAFIEPGITTRTEVTAQLGDRYLQSTNGHWWVFPAYRRMTEWVLIIWYPPVFDEAPFGEDIDQYYLIVEFATDDIVQDFMVVTGESPCVRDRSVCFHKGELTVRNSGGPTTLKLDSHRTIRDALLESEVTLRDGKIYELGESEPFTGHVAGVDHLGLSQWVRTYKNGELSGVETFWYQNGQVSYQAHYSNNLRHGPATSWNSDGSVSYETCYQNGIMVDLPIDQCRP